MQDVDRREARDRIQQLIDRIAWLRATGPNPFDYYQWADEVWFVCTDIFGEESEEVRRLFQAVGQRGRTLDQRGIGENMTLGLHGAWGIWARLERGEAVLRELVRQLEGAAA
ncbi:MAG TPA: hypothetical protein VIO14_06190 [Dehalococcoidia bacterium]